MNKPKFYRFPALGFEIWSENFPDVNQFTSDNVNSIVPGWRYPKKVEFNFLTSLRELGVFGVEDGSYRVTLPKPDWADKGQQFVTNLRTDKISTMGPMGGYIKSFLRPFRDI